MEESGAALIAKFQRVAGQFCDLIERSSSFSRADFVKLVHGLLVDLYRMGALLPHVEPDSDDASQDRISHDQWSKIRKEIGEKLQDVDVYWMVFDPADPADKEAIQNTLSNDLADIYRDLRGTRPASESDPLSNDALWSLRFDYEYHWGRHAASALTAIHSLLHGPSYLSED